MIRRLRRFSQIVLWQGVAAAIIVCLMMSGCSRSLDADGVRLFQDSQKTFDAARDPQDFLKAAAIDQELIDRGWVSGAVYYNQGNAFMRAGERGRAIAAYRQAERYLGHDTFLEANLAFALGSSATAPRRPLVDYIFFWQDWISYPNKFYLAGGVVLLTFSLAVTALFFRSRALSCLVALGLFASTVLIVSAGYDYYRYGMLVHGAVTEKKAVVRKGDAENYEPAFTEPLEAGTEFLLIEHRGNWLLIQLSGGQQGWIRDKAAVTY